MSGDEQAAAIGQMVMRYGEAKKQLILVSAELTRIGEVFKAAGTAISLQPGKVQPDDRGLSLHKGYGEPDKVDRAVFDFDRLSRLLTEHWELTATIATLEPQLRELGVIPSR